MSMYKIYIEQIWALIRQKRFLSLVCIVGTGLVISMVMMLAVAYHIHTVNIVPEMRRDRMCYLSNVIYKLNSTKSNYKVACGPCLVEEAIGNSRVPEDVVVTTNSFTMSFPYGDVFMRLPGGDGFPKVRLKGYDDGFWRVYRFDLVEERSFIEAEFLSGMPRAALRRSLAGRLFGYEVAVGQMILPNGSGYTVSGVADDVSGITADVYAEVWVTYSFLSVATDHALGEHDGAVGLLEANILPADASGLSALSEELRREVRRYNSGLSEGQAACEEFLSYADNLPFGLLDPETHTALEMVLLLFLLVPALDPSGMNTSRTQERVGEPGIRRAFGAMEAAPMGQTFMENMVLMLPGGAAGLLFSYVLVFISRNVLLVPGSNPLGTSRDVFLSSRMLFNMSVFAYAFGVCVALNLLPLMLPAWRTVRGNVMDTLNG